MRRTPSSVLLLVAVATCSPLFGQGTLRNGWHEDTKNGYKVRIPDKWEAVPVALDEKWIVAKYLAERAVAIKKGEYSGMEAKPQLRVLVFSDEARKFKPAEVKAESRGGRAKEAEIPYKDYKDYIKRNGQDGGYFFSKETETKVGEIPCWQYEIKFEKLTVPRHVLAWVFRGDAADYALEYEVLEDSWEKFQPAFIQSLNSFKLIKRDSATVGTAGGSSTGSGGAIPTDPSSGKEREAWKALSAKERADRRKSTEESQFARSKEKLPPGWTVKMAPHFLILSHTDAKFVDKVVEAAEACRNWLDKNLGSISDEYALRAVIRVCADYDEYRAYYRGSDDSDATVREIVTYKDPNMTGRRSGGFDGMYSGLLRNYLRDKDSNLLYYAPPWVIIGLGAAVSSASAEGGTLKFGADPSEADMLRDLMKTAKKPGAKELMEMPIDKLYESPANRVFAGRLARYFLASKKDFIVNYLKASIEVADELTKTDPTERKAATTEEEEEALAKERREAGKKRFTEMIQKVHDKAAKWTDKEWQALETAFAAAK